MAESVNKPSSPILFSEVVSSSEVTFSASDTRWEISSSKPGWTPLIYSSVTNGFSARIVTNVELASLTNGHFIAHGYGRTHLGDTVTTKIQLCILWRKN